MRTELSDVLAGACRVARSAPTGLSAILATVFLVLGGPASGQKVSPSVAVSTALESALVAALPQEAPASGRTRLAEIVAKEIGVATDEATLRLDLAGGEDLEIRLEDGRVHLNGEDIGSFDEDEAAAWRELLVQAVALDDGPLARALVEWEPPEGTAGVLERVDRALEEALERPAAASEMQTSGDLATLARLLTRTDRLAALAAALDDLDVEEVTIRIGEDVVVREGEEIDGTLLVIDGDVEIEGRVREHVVVVGGTLRTAEGSAIDGDVRLADTRFVRDGGTIDGIVREFEGSSLEARIDSRVREAERRVRDAEEEVQRAAERAARVHEERSADEGFFTPLRRVSHSIGHGIAGLMQTFAALVVLSLLGGLMVLFGQQNLEVVAETARKSPGRSAMVGLAGAFLMLPVWVLGAVALAISIIGIPVLIAWLPLFPLAVAAAAALGYFAVAHNTGQWLARHRYPYLDWIRSSNTYTLVVGGVLGLLGAFFLAHVVGLFGPWLGFLKGILYAGGVVVSTAAVLVGFGAVLLTRAGRRPEYYTAGGGDPFDDGWDWDPSPTPEPSTGPAGDAGASAASADASAAEGEDHESA